MHAILVLPIVIVFLSGGGGYSLEFLSVLRLHVVIIKEEEETMCLCVNEELKPLQY